MQPGKISWLFLNELWFESTPKSAAWISDLNNFTLFSPSHFPHPLYSQMTFCTFKLSDSQHVALLWVSLAGPWGPEGCWGADRPQRLVGRVAAWQVAWAVFRGAGHAGFWLEAGSGVALLHPVSVSVGPGAGSVVFGHRTLQRPELPEETSPFWGDVSEAECIYPRPFSLRLPGTVVSRGTHNCERYLHVPQRCGSAPKSWKTGSEALLQSCS